LKLSSALASDAAGGQGVLDPILFALRAGASVAGPAATVNVTLAATRERTACRELKRKLVGGPGI